MKILRIYGKHLSNGNFIESHRYEIELEKQDDLFCPNCGKKKVYREMDEGDYYQGPDYYCISCKCNFTMPSFGEMNKDFAIV
jgi:predicted RNA-binding Zn-ribbon protein involved in translation (DUF1610 family)